MQLGNYQVRIYHSNTANKGTAIELYKGNDVIGTGSTRVHKTDQFVKAKGRKVALTRALLNANLPREERMTVWNSYWQKFKK